VFRTRTIAIALVLIAIAVLVAREVRNHQNKKAAFAVVYELDGQIGTIPFEPFGTEYRIEFHNRNFTAEELQRLCILNRLTGRNWVRVAFVDTNVTREDMAMLRERVPDILLIRIVGGEMIDAKF
jgi:hypothetical protein